MKLMKVLVTGASGFVGRALMERLPEDPMLTVRAAVRQKISRFSAEIDTVQVGELSATTNWQAALAGIDVVIHTAARVHVMNDKASDSLAEFRRTNVAGTLALAQQAATSGVKRFIVVSSIGVNGALTFETPFDEQSIPAPHTDYAVSKFEAEEELQKLLLDSSMELVIIRPPLIYAGNAPGNFQRLLKLVAAGVPLPFSKVNNRRSMVALENFIDFVVLCVKHPAAANQLFLISDGIEVSTPDIIRHLADGMDRQPLLFPVPLKLMEWTCGRVGKQAVYTQLCGSLVIDSSKARQLLTWHPPVSPADALAQAGRDYKSMVFRRT